MAGGGGGGGKEEEEEEEGEGEEQEVGGGGGGGACLACFLFFFQPLSGSYRVFAFVGVRIDAAPAPRRRPPRQDRLGSRQSLSRIAVVLGAVFVVDVVVSSAAIFPIRPLTDCHLLLFSLSLPLPSSFFHSPPSSIKKKGGEIVGFV